MKRKLLLLSLCILFSMEAGGRLPAGEIRGVWRSLPPVPTSRQEVGIAELDGIVYVIGGLVTGAASTALEAFDTESGEWVSLAALPEALHHVAAAEAGGRIFSIGGFLGFTFNPVDTLLEYDPVSDQWAARTPLPMARGALAAATIEGKIYAVGGDGPGGPFGQFAVYEPGTGIWTELPPLPTPREHLAAAAIGTSLYVIGGRTSVPPPLHNVATLEVFDTIEGTWKTRTPMPTARSGLAAASHGGLLFVLGGEIQGVFDENEVYDPATDTWFDQIPMPVPRHGIGAAVVGNRIIIPGGATRQGFNHTDVADEFLVVDRAVAMAQFADGPGVDSEVSATNDTDSEATALLELYDSQGNVLESSLTGPGGEERLVELQSHQSVRWQTDGSQPAGAGETQVGWALLFSDQPLLGNIIFSGSFGFAGVLGGEPGKSFVARVQRSESQNSGVALGNASRFPATVTLRLLDADGVEVAKTDVQLQPFGHRALFLDELFPELEIPSFFGVLEGSSDQLTAVMAILQRGTTQLATLPARINP